MSKKGGSARCFCCWSFLALVKDRMLFLRNRVERAGKFFDAAYIILAGCAVAVGYYF